ncbi:MAG: hypothetical protein KBS68_07490 [Clostridiales bacterium]|nr:hypothetical protein [Candidatus Crickella merdequi]
MKNKRKLFIFSYLVLLAVCILIVYVFPTVKGFTESTYIVEHGSVELSQKVDAYIVRNETVYSAGKAGTVNQLAKEGELVRVGTSIVSISGEGKEEVSDKYAQLGSNIGDKLVVTETGASQNAGFVCYSVDGSEGKLCYDNIEKIKKDTLIQRTGVKLLDAVSGKCAKGEPVYKIVANGDWWLVFYVSNDDAERYPVGRTVKFTMGDETVSADVIMANKGKTETKIVLSCSVMMKDYMTIRKTDINVIAASAKGLIIKNKSIVERDNQKGVIVKTKLGKNKFVPIVIKATDGDKAAVCEDTFFDLNGNEVKTINVYDEIVTSPKESDVRDAE